MFTKSSKLSHVFVGVVSIAVFITVIWDHLGQSRRQILAPSPSIKTWQTSQGATVLFVESHDLPLVDISLAFPAGSRYDHLLPGVANMTVKMLGEGTKRYNADQIALGFDRVGALYVVGVNQDQAVLSLRSMSQIAYLGPSVALFHEVLTMPAFPAEAFKRIQHALLRQYDAMSQKPNFLARKLFLRSLYGQQGYGHVVLGEPAVIAKLRPDDLRQFYHGHFLANQAVLALVGDIDESQAHQLAEQVLQGLPQGDSPKVLEEHQVQEMKQPTGSQIESQTRSRTVHARFPSKQTAVIIGGLGIARDNPDYYPLVVGNHVLGSGMTSRLFQTVREKAGLAYSIGSGFFAQAAPGPFGIFFSTRNGQVKAAVAKTKAVLSNFVAQSITEEELDSAKRHLSNSYIFSIASNAGLASVLVNMGFYHLPLDTITHYPKMIESVTQDQIKHAFVKHVEPQSMVTVMVGGDD